ncbi:MAG: hypothetical protein KatS3mg131_2225 [Candidatus Tectimicrobiota bacterium]|nr:MAG: hypothetical protein KatS3mg131_2225 [Candidatus Tectomicrobia bacterium]
MDVPRRPAPIPEGHPLRHLFRRLTEASFEQVGMPDRDLMTYVTGLLIDFTHVDNLYRRDATGQRLEYVVDFLIESRRGDTAHARETHKHLGDFALFMVGMFPESLRRRWRAVSPDYYVAHGKQAYSTVSEIDSPKPSAALFRKLAAHFETCVLALNVEKTWIRDAFYQYLMRQLLS